MRFWCDVQSQEVSACEDSSNFCNPAHVGKACDAKACVLPWKRSSGSNALLQAQALVVPCDHIAPISQAVIAEAVALELTQGHSLSSLDNVWNRASCGSWTLLYCTAVTSSSEVLIAVHMRRLSKSQKEAVRTFRDICPGALMDARVGHIACSISLLSGSCSLAQRVVNDKPLPWSLVPMADKDAWQCRDQ